MSSLGERITPRDVASLRHKTSQTVQDKFTAMGERLGWALTLSTDPGRSEPISTFRRGPWELHVRFTIGGYHAKRAVLLNPVSLEKRRPLPEKSDDPTTGKFDPMRNSQNVFRFVGQVLYDESLR